MINTKWILPLAFAGGLTFPAIAFLLPGDAATETQSQVQDPKDAPKDAPKKKDKTLKLGSVLPKKLALPDFDGKSHSFDDLRGKVVIVHFWSHRCPAERHANPIFRDMQKLYKDSKDVVIVGICSNQPELGEEPKEGADHKKLYGDLRKKVKAEKLNHLMLVDHGNKVSSLFAARSTPHCFVFDKKGKLRYSGALDNDPRGRKGKEATNYLVDTAKALLADKQPEVTNTKPYG